jgi:hypothetical protein
MAPASNAQVVYETPRPHSPLRNVRSTLLVVSYRAVQKLGREEDYLRALPLEHRGTVVGAVAGTWVPVDGALAHYRACDALGLSYDAQVEIGRSVGVHLRGTLFGTVMNISKEMGVTPFSVIPSVPRLWPRIFDGSAMSIQALGPKEARLNIMGLPLADVPYFRNALRGQIMGMLDLFCTRTFVSLCAGQFASGATSLRIQWA